MTSAAKPYSRSYLCIISYEQLCLSRFLDNCILNNQYFELKRGVKNCNKKTDTFEECRELCQETATCVKFSYMTEAIRGDGSYYQNVWPRTCCMKGNDILYNIFDYVGAISGLKKCTGEIRFFPFFQLYSRVSGQSTISKVMPGHNPDAFHLIMFSSRK